MDIFTYCMSPDLSSCPCSTKNPGFSWFGRAVPSRSLIGGGWLANAGAPLERQNRSGAADARSQSKRTQPLHAATIRTSCQWWCDFGGSKHISISQSCVFIFVFNRRIGPSAHSYTGFAHLGLQLLSAVLIPHLSPEKAVTVMLQRPQTERFV